MHNKELIIFGDKGLAVEIFEVAETHYSDRFDDIRIIFFEDGFIKKNDLAEKISTPGYTLNFILGTIDYSVRTECLAGINKMKSFVPFTIIHP